MVQKRSDFSTSPVLNMTVCGVGSAFWALLSTASVKFMQIIFGFLSCRASTACQHGNFSTAACGKGHGIVRRFSELSQGSCLKRVNTEFVSCVLKQESLLPLGVCQFSGGTLTFCVLRPL